MHLSADPKCCRWPAHQSACMLTRLAAPAVTHPVNDYKHRHVDSNDIVLCCAYCLYITFSCLCLCTSSRGTREYHRLWVNIAWLTRLSEINVSHEAGKQCQLVFNASCSNELHMHPFSHISRLSSLLKTQSWQTQGYLISSGFPLSCPLLGLARPALM